MMAVQEAESLSRNGDMSMRGTDKYDGEREKKWVRCAMRGDGNAYGCTVGIKNLKHRLWAVMIESRAFSNFCSNFLLSTKAQCLKPHQVCFLPNLFFPSNIDPLSFITPKLVGLIFATILAPTMATAHPTFITIHNAAAGGV